MKIVLTCEHGGNIIPKPYQSFFTGQDLILNSHRGYDLGALDVFHALESIADFSKFSTTSRLLIELNRSLRHKSLFSEFTCDLSKEDKHQIIDQFYKRYRDAVQAEISKFIQQGELVLHVSIHSFTPIWNGKERPVDIGLLYDSRIPKEKKFCRKFKTELLKLNIYTIRFNQPYLGKADGFSTYLRKRFPENYIGVELEINQKYAIHNQMSDDLKSDLLNALDFCK